MSAPPSVYLAGPDVFLPDSAEVGRRKQAICRAHGLEGHYPGEEVDLAGLEPAEQARALFESCVTMMDRCVAGLANVTPFRGVSADVGTAFEMGYLFGRGFPVWGYTSHAADYAVHRESPTTASCSSRRSAWPTTSCSRVRCCGASARSCGSPSRVRAPPPRSTRSRSWCGSRPPSSAQ